MSLKMATDHQQLYHQAMNVDYEIVTIMSSRYCLTMNLGWNGISSNSGLLIHSIFSNQQYLFKLSWYKAGELL